MSAFSFLAGLVLLGSFAGSLSTKYISICLYTHTRARAHTHTHTRLAHTLLLHSFRTSLSKEHLRVKEVAIQLV